MHVFHSLVVLCGLFPKASLCMNTCNTKHMGDDTPGKTSQWLREQIERASLFSLCITTSSKSSVTRIALAQPRVAQGTHITTAERHHQALCLQWSCSMLAVMCFICCVTSNPLEDWMVTVMSLAAVSGKRNFMWFCILTKFCVLCSVSTTPSKVKEQQLFSTS